MKIRVIAGTGRYTDPWHPFLETSVCIADLLGDLGHQAEVVESTPETITGLAGVDLAIVNCGGNPEVELTPDPAWSRAFGAFGRWIEDGHPILGIHAASNAFPDWPAWPDLLGGRWVRGRSHHPPRTEFTFDATAANRDHPALGGLSQVTVVDERYSGLELFPSAVPLLQHRLDGADQVMVWATDDGRRRAVYDGLGHNAESYDSPDRRRLLAAEVGWLLEAAL